MGGIQAEAESGAEASSEGASSGCFNKGSSIGVLHILGGYGITFLGEAI